MAKFHLVPLHFFLVTALSSLVQPSIHVQNYKDELILAQVFFRHGDRSPLSTFPKNHVNVFKVWPTGLGQLTPQGKRQGYELGSYLRTRYASLIRETYYPEDIYILSSDIDRTILTATSVVQGLYPQKSSWWGISYPAVPVHTIPYNIDNIIAFAAPCPRYGDELNKFRDGVGYETDLQNSAYYAYVANHTGIPVEDVTFETVAEVYDTLYVQKAHGLGIPSWVAMPAYPKQDPSLIRRLAVLPFQALTDSDISMKLRGGPLLQEIVKNIEAMLPSKSNDTTRQRRNKHKLRLYSGHDTTVTSVLQLFGVYNDALVPYVGAFMLELYKRTDTQRSSFYYLKAFYKNCTENSQHELLIPGCQDVVTKDPRDNVVDGSPTLNGGCRLDSLIRLKKGILSVDWKSLCTRGSIISSFFNLLNVGRCLCN